MAAAFAEPAEAEAAEAELRASLDVGPADIALAPVGGDPARSGLRALLAGRFRQHRTHLVESIVRRNRGRVLEDVSEARVRPMSWPSGPPRARI
jgi:hypothetical protein